MTDSISGGCACGAIRYTCQSKPIAMLNCHCKDCQQSSGAPFASGFVVASADLKVTGAPTAYSVRASSGSLAARSFCSICGTPLFTVGELRPEFTSIRFPTMDDASAFKPVLDIWTESAQNWTRFDQSIPQFQQSPQ